MKRQNKEGNLGKDQISTEVKVGKRLEFIDTRKDFLNIKVQVFFPFLFRYKYVYLRAEGERGGRKRSGEKCIAP